MSRRAALIAGSLLTAAFALAPQVASAQAAPTAESVAAHVMQSLGGQQAWDNTRYIRFNFVGRRAHWWDKWSGRHRVEWDSKEKQHYVVLENVNTKEGKAWLDGKPSRGTRPRRRSRTPTAPG